MHQSNCVSTVRLVCLDNNKTSKLIGTGILWINEPCYVTTPKIILIQND